MAKYKGLNLNYKMVTHRWKDKRSSKSRFKNGKGRCSHILIFAFGDQFPLRAAAFW